MNASLGERELDVMGELWRGGAGTVADIRDRLPVSLAYNTVLTILRNLESKGYVGHTANGRLFSYFPAVTEEAVRGSALTRLVNKLFRGSPAGVVAHLVEAESLSPAELQSLHQLLVARLGANSSNDSGNATPRGSAAKASTKRKGKR